ncbi:CHASE2 domain-containing protein [Aerosakkonema sp. BLCC-F183]|uniref:CHASE2 domain-containing protein n=1 Tax=Aerosakkonema sp. BLCC-F183 TaxID=3342834 RepID=UPI0035B88B5C
MYKKRQKRYQASRQGNRKNTFLFTFDFYGFAKYFSKIDFARANFALASFAVTGFLLFAIHLGLLQPLELVAYDQMVRLVENKQPDPRLLVIAITEADIRAQRWPLSDRTVAQVLQNLQLYKPKVIGLDIYRDVPQQPGYELFLQQLKSPNIIVITDDAAGIPPPKGVPKERIGFNDLLVDSDGVIRRNLLFIPTETGVLRSFALLLAQAYLADRGILPKSSRTKPAYLQLGKAVFTRLESDSGGYQNIDARGYQILLNYRSAQPVARQVTLAEVIRGQVDPSWIKDKIVIIGSTAPSLNDLFLTPYSPTQQENYKMSGVLIHAQMVSQILNAAVGEKPLFWFWDEWMEVLWILGWALIGGSLAAYFRRPLVLSILEIGAIALVILSCFYLFTQHGWVPIASPILAVSIAGGAVVLNRSYTFYQQQQMVMKLLGKNTSPEIAAAFWQHRDRLLKSGKLPGQTLTATLLFSDIKDFSTIAEQMSPTVLLEWLNEYFSAIAQEVQVHHGIINKFIGDGIMAVFGVPICRTTREEIAQDAYSAVACALAMGDRLQELNSQLLRRGLPTIQMRIGIFTGPVVAGSLGGKDRLEYGIIGDSVNIASRLESCCKDLQPSSCRVLIARETFVYIDGKFQVEYWGPIDLKGRRQSVEIYRVVSKKDEKQPQSEKT